MVCEVKSPILGFENIKYIKISPIDDIFAKFEDIDTNISFTLLNPYSIREYEFDIPTDIQKLMDINDNCELRVYNMIVVGNPVGNSFVNFTAPIVCNLTNKTVGQVVLDPVKYPHLQCAQQIGQYLPIFTVKSPILGFENIKHVLLNPIDKIFTKLEDTQSKTSFTLIDPYVLTNYEFEIPTYYQDLMQINENSELKIYNILAICKPIEKSSVNFIAPIVCNETNKTISQVILDPFNYRSFKQAQIIEKFIKK